MSFQKNSFKHTSRWQLRFREIINKKGKASFETDAAVAKPGQRRNATTVRNFPKKNELKEVFSLGIVLLFQ